MFSLLTNPPLLVNSEILPGIVGWTGYAMLPYDPTARQNVQPWPPTIVLEKKECGAARKSAQEELARKLMTQQLEKIVSVAVQEKDASITKKKCRQLLTVLFGEARVEEHKEHLSTEVMRVLNECREMEEAALAEFVEEGCRAVEEDEIKALDEHTADDNANAPCWAVKAPQTRSLQLGPTPPGFQPRPRPRNEGHLVGNLVVGVAAPTQLHEVGDHGYMRSLFLYRYYSHSFFLCTYIMALTHTHIHTHTHTNLARHFSLSHIYIHI